MPEEVAPGIWRIDVPLAKVPLGSVNVYAIEADDGLRLVDCGWDTPEAYSAISEGLQSLGGISAIREILVTHIHPDHFGLADRLVHQSGAHLLMHRREAAFVNARYQEAANLIATMEEWLRINGVPSIELEAMAEGSMWMLKHVRARKPDRELEGGETLAWGGYQLETLWTPGHSPGLICLYSSSAQILISSDHILKRISPHIGLHAQSLGQPLRDYLQSLSMVRDLPVSQVLPGHGMPFTRLQERVDELIAHHRHRVQEVLELVDTTVSTTYAIATHLRWRGSDHGWEKLDPFQRRMAVTETSAHLEHAVQCGLVHRHLHDGVAVYSPAEVPTTERSGP